MAKARLTGGIIVNFKILATALALAWSSIGNTAVTIYTDSGEFTDELSDPATEDFGDTTLVTGLAIASTVGNINNGLFNDRPVAGSAETTFTFAGGANGFGGIFNLEPGGRGQGLEFILNLIGGGTETAGRLQNEPPGFFGFTSTNRFNSVTLRGFDTAQGVAETYNLDNAQFGNLAAAVPEPATWAMMIVGFGFIGGSLRSRRTLSATYARG